MKMSDAFPSKYLQAADFKGHPRAFTIERVDTERVGKDQDLKSIVFFEEAKKGLVLNKTNWKRIEEITGQDDSTNWLGHQIVLYPTRTVFGSEEVDCIRVKAAGADKPGVKVMPMEEPFVPGSGPDDAPDSDISF